ncbi:hypothetical protein CDAR_579851 [Caerostris darwini]|uniref:Uncharacterized protein n=1 Tax=Caerostris darwini TaxID=1538125 RepID=A0AAV4PZA9_9ARAC|nr:hypothetical protein CDAR_579851 [Caerostris darwini]
MVPEAPNPKSILLNFAVFASEILLLVWCLDAKDMQENCRPLFQSPQFHLHPVIRCQRHARKLPASFPELTVPPAVISRLIGPTAQNDTPFQKNDEKGKLKNKKGVGGRVKGG